MRHLSLRKGKGIVRRLMAAAFLMLVALDLSGHAFVNSRDASGPQAWCVKFHYTHPEIDCPHKRNHQQPHKSAFDEVGHLAVLLKQEDLQPASGISYRS